MYREKEKRFYEKEWNRTKLSPKLDRVPWKTNVPNKDVISFIKYLKEHKIRGKVLDIGCGGGRHAIAFARAGFQVYGIDFSPSALKVAKENARKSKVSASIKFFIGDALDLPFGSNFFDAVNDSGCLHHIDEEDMSRYVQGVKKVLKKGGILKITEAYRNCEFFKKRRKAKKGNWIRIKGSHTYFFSKAKIKTLFGEGFKILFMEPVEHAIDKEKKSLFVIMKKR